MRRGQLGFDRGFAARRQGRSRHYEPHRKTDPPASTTREYETWWQFPCQCAMRWGVHQMASMLANTYAWIRCQPAGCL
jgi:hypothetical protein